ncbi:MAG: 3-oxoacyl-[acyl-carrier-protein] reductase [Terriglobia bacterium]
MLLKDKKAMISGGSQGIGKAIARVLAEAGADVAIGGRNLDKLNLVADELRETGRQIFPIQMDVTRPEDVRNAFSQISSSWGRLDILVNNAGITKDGLLLRMKVEEWDLVLESNLKGVFLCTQEAIKIMLRQRYGRIINISSVVGQTGNPGQANYVASKAGIDGFTRSIALEVASRNITVNSIAPGFIDTAMTQALSDAVKSKLLERIPLGRMGLDREVAYGVRFLASDEAAYITGHTLNVNGGLYM